MYGFKFSMQSHNFGCCQMENKIRRKPRILCLHSFRTSGGILQKQISRWPANVTGELDLVFADAPFLAEGKSDVEGIYDPPYFEWFQSDKVQYNTPLVLPGIFNFF
ncbi:UNVERIFIED_CONTAM: hypothetical protein Sradi_0812800 [Sesamum radiatum]|uniref:Serine hydrolase domain-containing protein n=1 Tax=Sesamum radiatum TaxID=300843 RepID=A0AAW2VRS5_SESRA